jgi:hypothetical protein
MAYLCSQWTPNDQHNYFMLDWSIYTLFVLNRGCKCESLQIMIFVHVWLTWSIVELKTRFETFITRNDLNGVFTNTYGLPVLTTDTKWPNYVFYVWLVDLQTICAKYGLETWCSANDYIRKYLLDMKHGSKKTRFETSITRNDINGVSLFHLSYLLTLMAYLRLQWTPNIQIKYFMTDWC